MELTGKCKEEFEKWYNEVQKYNIGWFYRLQSEYQYGVLVDYFDSVGNRITINAGISLFWVDIYTDLLKDINWDSEYFATREEAIDVAIEKADELRNEILNK